MEIAINVLMFLLGGYWVQQGITVYKFWYKGLPGSGFMPVLFGLFLMALTGFLAGIAVKKRVLETGKGAMVETQHEESKKSDDTYPSWIKPLVPAVYIMFAIILMVTVGVLPAMFLTAFIWLVGISKIKLVKSFLISLIITLCVFVVFVLWLKIPFPRGVFGI
ncbi:MAG: tripartite tricarboxylate transporter TctB family protein [Sphaerochaeta sp.]|nr:tripartite tricarboxylate transporter TctB family protein [Sphaerochaeta sp.]